MVPFFSLFFLFFFFSGRSLGLVRVRTLLTVCLVGCDAGLPRCFDCGLVGRPVAEAMDVRKRVHL
jgi:hypothetical protein